MSNTAIIITLAALLVAFVLLPVIGIYVAVRWAGDEAVKWTRKGTTRC